MQIKNDYAQCFNELPDHIGWICDGDTSAAVSRDTGGITNAGYIGSGVPYQAESALLGDVLKVKIGDRFHRFQDIRVYPFGIASRCDGAEVTFAVNQYSIMVEVRDPKRRPISFLFDQTCLNRGKNMFWELLPYDSANQAVRLYFTAFWNQHRNNPDPEKEDKADSPDLRHMPDKLVSAQVYIEAGLTCKDKHRELHNSHVFTSKAKSSMFAIVFGETNEECRSRFLGLRGRSVFAEQKTRYDRLYARTPKVNIKQYPGLSEMINLLPLYYECLKIWDQDGQGTIRGTNSVDGWLEGGWDQLHGGFGLLWAKDYEYTRKIIRFYRALAKPSGKIPHAVTLDQRPTIHMDRYDLEDYLMLALIARYFDFVKDEVFLREIMPFYTKLFMGIAALSNQRTGFIACEGMYPDFPWKVAGRERVAYPCMEQISLYAVCCKAEKLGKKTGNAALSETARKLKEKIRANFGRYFFDKEKGWLYESVSLDGYKPNPCYPKWNIFGLGLKDGESLFDKTQLKRMAEFALKNFFEGDDLRSVPLWDKGAKLAPHDTDVGVWTTLSYPLEDLCLYNLFKYAGHRPGMKKTLARMERIYSMLRIVPELVPTSQTEFKEDLYSYVRTRWLPLSMGPWHCTVMEGLLNVDAENGKIRKPGPDKSKFEYKGF